MKVLIISLSFICFAVMLLVNCGSDTGVYKGVRFSNHTKTAKGVSVYGPTTADDQTKRLIDAGLDTVFQIAAGPPNNYTGFTGHDTYTVWLQQRSSRCEQAGFLVDATGSPYEGTVYDKDPAANRCLICAAGMMMLNNGRPGMVVVNDPAVISTVVQYEGEHNILWQTDLPRYQQTQFHTGSGHPILGGSGSLTEHFQGGSIEQGSGRMCVLLVQ